MPVRTIAQLFELIMIRDGVYGQFSASVDGSVLDIDEKVNDLFYLCCLDIIIMVLVFIVLVCFDCTVVHRCFFLLSLLVFCYVMPHLC